MTTMTQLRIESTGPALEAVLYAPDVESSTVVVVCHPHPQRGGDMHNNVVTVVVQALNAAGIAALTFNFRGVGRSEGAFDNGAGEKDDVRAALDHARSLSGVRRVGLAGYSFGAGMAAAVVDDSCLAVCLVSGNAGAMGSGSGLSTYAGPSLLIMGDNDRISTPDALRSAASSMACPAEVVIVPGADHFWWGHEPTLYEALRSFFASSLAELVAG